MDLLPIIIMFDIGLPKHYANNLKKLRPEDRTFLFYIKLH